MFFSRDLTLPNDSVQMTLSPSTFHGVSYRSNDWSMVDKLCILPEDDPQLESKIWDAINYGQCQCPFLQLISTFHIQHKLNQFVLLEETSDGL